MTPACKDGQIRRYRCGLRLQKQMIVLADKGQSLQIPSAKAGKHFAGLKLDVDLIADKATDLVDLIAVVGGDSDAAVNDPPRWDCFQPMRSRSRVTLQMANAAKWIL